MEPTTPTSPTEQTAPIVTHSKKNWLLFVAVAVILIALGAGAIFYSKSFVSNALPGITTSSSIPFVIESTTTPSYYEQDGNEDYKVADAIAGQQTIPANYLPRAQAQAASGTPLTNYDEYHLFRFYAQDPTAAYYSPAPPASNLHYYDDGTIPSGPYTGYHLVIAEYPPDGPGGSIYYTFATKDYQTFVVEGKKGEVPNPVVLNTNKVTGVDVLPTNFPQTIRLNNSFTLTRNIYFGTNTDIATSGPESGATLLGTVASGQRVYSAAQTLIDDLQQWNDATDTAVAIKLKPYIDSTTLVQVCDASNICFSYDLSFTALSGEDQKMHLTSDGGTSTYAPVEVFPNHQDARFYTDYANLIASGCSGAFGGFTYAVKNISDSDLVATGRSWAGVELYALKNATSSPLVQALYEFKNNEAETGFVFNAEVSSTSVNHLPDLATYTNKYPILFFKDPWGRWVGTAENSYEFSPGCGKPVVYLYPTKPTQISLSFPNTPDLKISIPTYTNGWNVLAKPSGTLTDLQPSATDCDKIDSARFGSEYAKAACASHTYPYLYWAGYANNTYPTPTGGWIVDRTQLDSFMKDKLRQIGLTDSESRDMRSYWVPMLLRRSEPYYRLSFFTTEQMNRFVPMHVAPAPDSVLRVFLDWTALNEKPAVSPQPQQFTPFTRNGFTMVEWGGLE